MGRRKVRNYPSKQYYERVLEQYFEENRDDVIRHTCDVLGFGNLEELRKAEYSSYFGLDCGWVILSPKNSEMAREWKLDNGQYDYQIFADPSYNPQSVTIKEVEVKKAVKDLGLGSEFYVYSKLD